MRCRTGALPEILLCRELVIRLYDFSILCEEPQSSAIKANQANACLTLIIQVDYFRVPRQLGTIPKALQSPAKQVIGTRGRLERSRCRRGRCGWSRGHIFSMRPLPL